MTGAHLGDRGACRRRSCSVTAAPREGARRRGHGDGHHHPRSVAAAFFAFSAHELGTYLPIVLPHMDQTERF